jgi:hypothetical protein
MEHWNKILNYTSKPSKIKHKNGTKIIFLKWNKMEQKWNNYLIKILTHLSCKQQIKIKTSQTINI